MEKNLYIVIGGEKIGGFMLLIGCMSEEEFKEAFSDEEFVKELLSLKTGEQVRKALAKKGIFLTPDELDKFAEVLIHALEKNKVPEEELKNCSGGVKNDVEIGAEVLANLVTPEMLKNSDGFFLGFLDVNK